MRYSVSIAFLLTAVTIAQSGEPAFRRDLLAGSWKLDREKSKMQNDAPASRRPAMYREYRDSGDGFMLHTVMLVSSGGEKATLQLLGAVRYDGKEYPTFTQERLTSFLTTGRQPLQTVSFRVIEPYKMEWTDRTAGRITAGGTMTLAKDGRTLTITDQSYKTDGKQTAFSVLVYEKQ